MQSPLCPDRLSRARATLLAAIAWSIVCVPMCAQTSAPPTQTSNVPTPQTVPDAPDAIRLQQSEAQTASQTAEEREAARIAALGKVNGKPYDQPSHKDQFFDYLRDSYGWPAFARSAARALYSEARGKPSGWGQDLPGFGQRFGSAVAITAINGNVRFAMETIFSEDMRYIPCHGCSVKRKIGNALLAEVTARHDVNGHRFFTMTPAISDFSGPIIANYAWYPNHDPFAGVVATRTVFASRVGGHLFTEFVLERRHHDPKLDN